MKEAKAVALWEGGTVASVSSTGEVLYIMQAPTFGEGNCLPAQTVSMSSHSATKLRDFLFEQFPLEEIRMKLPDSGLLEEIRTLFERDFKEGETPIIAAEPGYFDSEASYWRNRAIIAESRLDVEKGRLQRQVSDLREIIDHIDDFYGIDDISGYLVRIGYKGPNIDPALETS